MAVTVTSKGFGMTIEDRERIQNAVSLSRMSVDFADALHLTASESCNELLAFENRNSRAVQQN